MVRLLKNSFYNSPQPKPDFATGVIPYPVRMAKSEKVAGSVLATPKSRKPLADSPSGRWARGATFSTSC
jgi:hypothetical protein